MKRVEFIYNPGHELPLEREIMEYESHITDTKINKDYEEWLLEKAAANGKSYWEEIDRTED